MRNFPAGFPNINSWMNAILLGFLLIIATTLGQIINSFFSQLIQLLFKFLSLFPELIRGIILIIVGQIYLFFYYLFSYLSPLGVLLTIVVIAFANHYLNVLLDLYYPDITLPEMKGVGGLVPGLISWWEGLYGLLVIILAMWVSDTILSIFPFLAFNYDLPNLDSSSSGRLFFWFYLGILLFTHPIYTPISRLLIWIITAAYLYQFESAVRNHLMSVGRRIPGASE